MIERRRIVELYRRGDAVALVTLVGVTGSSYRRVGARLLIAADGEYAGGISGGCLEAEVIQKAQWFARGGAVVREYSTLFDDTAEIPYGLGCGGTVELLIEPAGTAECAALMEALEGSLRGEACRVRTSLPGNGVGLRREIAVGPAVGAAETAGSADRVFVEELVPPQRLWIFGAGDDAQPVARFAAQLGWRVCVVDGRAQWARAERFPEAETICCVDARREAPGGVADLDVRPADAVVLMTHSYEQDRAWLTALLPMAPRYLGLLGARHRSSLLVAEAAGALEWTVERACAALFAPVGLDLGGDGAEAIALAIVAEIHAHCEGKLGHTRRLTARVVAEQIAQGGAARYLEAQCAL